MFWDANELTVKQGDSRVQVINGVSHTRNGIIPVRDVKLSGESGNYSGDPLSRRANGDSHSASMGCASTFSVKKQCL
ncbi:MAG: hypothetical protein LBG43_11040 [Treponema sp.]|jgi:hypothetical protein|nr:hypothetical protein [Treponema sp.]